MLAALLLVPSLAACLDVPQVSFAPDASIDVHADADGFPADAPDTSNAADSPTGAPDGVDDVAIADAGPDGASDGGACPGAVPPGASWCCGPVPCRGAAASCQAECTNCENDCPGQTCCLDKHGNYQGCAANAGACP